MIILGDQFPLGGGLLRHKALLNSMAQNKMPAEEIRYDWHDIDAPWKQNGNKDVKIARKFTDYWSLGLRHPFSLITPEVRLENVGSSFKSPNGLSFLTGPKTNKTIRSENKTSLVLENVKEIIIEDVEWMSKVAKIIGKNAKETEKKEKIIFEAVGKSQTIIELFCLIGEICLGFSGIKSTFEIYEENPIKERFLPDKFFWKISKDNFRRSELVDSSLNGKEIIVPKGVALFLDFSFRGFKTGFTGCGYLSKTEELRNQFLPSVKLKFIKISFNWTFPENPIDILFNKFLERKRKRGENILEMPTESLQVIKNFWQNRPTELAYFFLGGELNSSIREIIL